MDCYLLLMEKYQLNADEICYCFGDNLNDIEMLKKECRNQLFASMTVSNARPEVIGKYAAKSTCDTLLGKWSVRSVKIIFDNAIG